MMTAKYEELTSNIGAHQCQVSEIRHSSSTFSGWAELVKVTSIFLSPDSSVHPRVTQYPKRFL
jgi:hypothetical protein